MKARVQDNGETRDHRNPSDLSYGGTEFPGAGRNAILEDEADRMEGYAPCGDQDAPEVKTSVATEDVENPDGELNCHPERYCSENCYQRPVRMN